MNTLPLRTARRQPPSVGRACSSASSRSILSTVHIAAAAGTVALIEALLARGANADLIDHLGRNAMHWALLEAYRDGAFAKGPFGALSDLLAPSAVDVMSDERLVRIDKNLSEYQLFQALWVVGHAQLPLAPKAIAVERIMSKSDEVRRRDEAHRAELETLRVENARLSAEMARAMSAPPNW